MTTTLAQAAELARKNLSELRAWITGCEVKPNGWFEARFDVIERALASQAVAVAEPEPVDMVLHCPACGLQHIDGRETLNAGPDERGRLTPTAVTWDNPPHRSHLCHGCGHIWRPADVSTNGVQAVKTRGAKDSPVTSPPVQAPAEIAPTPASLDVLAERQRQITAEGWSTKHDNKHHAGSMALAAACYACNAATWAQRGPTPPDSEYTKYATPGFRWPWAMKWWKPKSQRQDLVRAGALILAEIERLDRAQGDTQ